MRSPARAAEKADPPTGSKTNLAPFPSVSRLTSATMSCSAVAMTAAAPWPRSASANGRVQSFEEIADREQKVERHIRFLVPLAFPSPRIVAAIANDDVSAGVTVSGLVRSLPFNWAEPQRRFALF